MIIPDLYWIIPDKTYFDEEIRELSQQLINSKDTAIRELKNVNLILCNNLYTKIAEIEIKNGKILTQAITPKIKTIGKLITHKIRDIPLSLSKKLINEYFLNNMYKLGEDLKYQLYRHTDGTGHQRTGENTLNIPGNFAADLNNNMLLRSIDLNSEINSKVKHHEIIINRQQVKKALEDLERELYLIIIVFYFEERRLTPPELQAEKQKLINQKQKHQKKYYQRLNRLKNKAIEKLIYNLIEIQDD